jgi:hypothetical protein
MLVMSFATHAFAVDNGGGGGGGGGDAPCWGCEFPSDNPYTISYCDTGYLFGAPSCENRMSGLGKLYCDPGPGKCIGTIIIKTSPAFL